MLCVTHGQTVDLFTLLGLTRLLFSPSDRAAMAGKTPQPACVEDFDDDAHDIVPDSRQVANTAAKLSRLDFRSPEPLIDGASDSGYSSRTAATVNSTQSGPSGGKSPPVPLKLDMPKRDLARNISRKDRKDKERERPRPVRDEKMQVGAYPSHLAHVPRSPSKPRRRDSVHVRHYHQQPEGYYEPYYPPPTPVEAPPPARNMEYPSYYFRPPIPDYPPPASPQHSRYPPGAIEEYHASRTSGRPSRSNSYRALYHQERPQSWAMGTSPMYHQSMFPYDHHGPPPSSSAFSNAYSSSPYGAGSYYAPSDYPAAPEYPRDRSRSRTREPSRSRRASVYAAPPDEVFPDWLEDGEPLERWYSREPPAPREPRGRPVKLTQDHDEDRHRMPPPPPPPPKHKSVPQIHQARRPEPRKAQTMQAIPSHRRSSRTAMDMSDLAAALPEDYSHRRTSREARLPERSNSLRDSRRSTSYHDTVRGAKVAVENSRRRRTQQYYYPDPGSSDGLEDREREVERYQAAQAGRSAAPVPLSAEALLPKSSNGAGSEAGSQKSRSNSSRGSGSASKAEDKNMTLIMNGMTIGFAEESLMGKSISIRTGDAGAMHLNIADGTQTTPASATSKRPKNYITGGSSYSDYTGGTGRRELEDVPRRPRDDRDRRSERASRRSSRSSYGHNRYQI